MVGYGPEDDHFVVELTYNYGITTYDKGNDFVGITIKSKETIERAKANNWAITEENGQKVLEAPGGYKFFILEEPQPTDKGKSILSYEYFKVKHYKNTTIQLSITTHFIILKHLYVKIVIM